MQNSYITTWKIYDFIDITDALGKYKTCNGCMLNYDDHFIIGSGFYATLCSISTCELSLPSHRLQIGQVVYLKWANLSRFSVRNNMTPEQVLCYIRPNANYGTKNEEPSLYKS